MSLGLKIFLIAFAVTAGLLLLLRILKKGGGKSFILSALQGIAAMFAVNIAGLVTGISLSVNLCSIVTSIVCGLPGVIGLLVMNLMLGLN